MGWGDCGTDSEGRPIGYSHPATCDEEGCTREIDRGLSYACGGEHGDSEYACENYFCSNHLTFCSEDEYLKEDGEPLGTKTMELCPSCHKAFEEAHKDMALA